MSVLVVATITPREGQLQKVLDALAVSIPLVHDEPGCELYAAHTDGKVVIMVERWETQDALDVHSHGKNLKTFGELAGSALVGAPAVTVLENVPFGQEKKGTIQ